MSSTERGLPALIAALARPGVLPEVGGVQAEVVQTHISVVFLAGERAYKLKKPVDFGFLDFSTPEKRARFCREELRLNRRLSPDIYLGIAPVWRRANGLVEVGAVSDDPPPADELLVAMKRLPRDRMMDALLDRGEVTAEQVERLARVVAQFHASAAHGPEVSRYGDPDNAGRHALDNFDQTDAFRGTLFDGALHRLMRRRTAGFLATRGRLFADRIARGAIRDGHGDLHSRNICLLADGRPVVYDCIEFSPAYRCGDVASEVGFLTMDLEFRGRADLAEVFLAAYRAESGDATLPAALPFYRAYRAMVRAKVAALTSSAAEVAPEERAQHGALARRLFALADRYTRGLTPPALVAVAGLTGVGKTAVAVELERAAGLTPLETDRIRKRLAGLDPDRPAPAGVGQGIYTAEMTRATYRALAREAATHLERGESALAVGTFVTRAQREEIRAVARQARIPLLFVQLSAFEPVVIERLSGRRPGQSDGTVEVFRSMLANAEAPDEIDGGELLALDASATSPGQLAEEILARLRAPLEGPTT